MDSPKEAELNNLQVTDMTLGDLKKDRKLNEAYGYRYGKKDGKNEEQDRILKLMDIALRNIEFGCPFGDDEIAIEKALIKAIKEE